MPPSPEQKVRELCRRALIKSKGDTNKAYETFNFFIIESNSAEIERELCKSYRSSALRAWIAETYQELRSEKKIPIEPPKFHIQTTNYQNPKGDSRKTGDLLHEQMQPKAIIRRYLDHFLVNGEPIGDCTAETVLKAAENRERDVKFMKYIASGVPPNGKIRDFKSEEDAMKCWKLAEKI